MQRARKHFYKIRRIFEASGTPENPVDLRKDTDVPEAIDQAITDKQKKLEQKINAFNLKMRKNHVLKRNQTIADGHMTWGKMSAIINHTDMVQF